MPKFSVALFNGIAPKVAPKLLAEGMAQAARNCDLGHGRLEPLREPLTVGSLPTSTNGGPVRTLYRYANQYWFQFFEDVDVVRGPLPDDATERTYFTDGQYPKVTRNDIAISAGRMPAAAYRLGVPAPTSPPTATVTGEGDTENVFRTAYVYTWVTAWGEEGPPSNPSVAVDIAPGQSVNVEFDDPPSGAYAWGLVRLYRLNTGSDGSYYQFVAEVPVPSSGGFADTVPNDSLGEVLPSETWYPPPDATHPTGPLQGLIGLPNGSLAGFTGQTLCVSEPYLPHAYPFENRYTINHNIVGLAPSPSGVIILTDAFPYIAAGTDPSAMPPQRMNEAQACVAKNSIVDMGGYTLYASPDGLVGIEGANARVLTEGLFDADQWRTLYNPSTIRAFFYEGRYIGFYKTTAGQGKGFIFNPRGERQAFIDLDLYAEGGFTDFATDTLYLNIANQLVKFDKGSAALPAIYRTKQFVSPTPVSMATVHVVAEGQVLVRVFADTVEVFAGSAIDDRPLRLPSGFRAKIWEVEVETQVPVDQIDLATSVLELQP